MAMIKIDQRRALHFAFFDAAQKGQKDVLEVLVRANVNIHESEDLALRLAAEFGQTETVLYLLEHGADIHAKCDNALLVAKANGHKATVALLQEWGKSPPPRP